MSWFQAVDDVWYNSDSIHDLSVRETALGWAVHGDGVHRLSREYASREVAQEFLDQFVSRLVLDERMLDYWKRTP